MIETWADFERAGYSAQRAWYFSRREAERSDGEIAAELGVPAHRITYWKKSRGIRTRKKYTSVFQGQGQALCWRCRKACGGCSWSRKLEPVAGWRAAVTEPPKYLCGSMRDIPNYCVIECPEFEEG
mgnify:CR=1 FL=1